jgi:hypothetical protein
VAVAERLGTSGYVLSGFIPGKEISRSQYIYAANLEQYITVVVLVMNILPTIQPLETFHLK